MVIKDHRNHISIDITRLKKELSSMENWDDWYAISDDIFNIKNWEYAEIESMHKDKQRTIKRQNDCIWFPLANTTTTDKKIEYLYEICQEMAFKKFEPGAYNEKSIDTKHYGKYCVICDIYTEESDIYLCPFCGKKLFLWNLTQV